MTHTHLTFTLAQDVKTIFLVGLAHSMSHFFHLILVPLFLYLNIDFGFTYAQLGFLVTLFFMISALTQTVAGFLVDRLGSRPLIIAAMAGFIIAALILSMASSYMTFILGVVIAGLCNSVFHPADFTILNNRVSSNRLGYAFTVHGLSGHLGWALATVFLTILANYFGWRHALQAAAGLTTFVLIILWWGRDYMYTSVHLSPSLTQASNHISRIENRFSFLKWPNVWISFLFFALISLAFSSFQSFGVTLMKQYYQYSSNIIGIIATMFLICGAIGMIAGGWLVIHIPRNDKQVGWAYFVSAMGALCIGFNLASPFIALIIIAIMGFVHGLATPSRDMLMKRSIPKGATGRVYGLVYSGADVGSSVGPMVCGWMIDHHLSHEVFLMLAGVQLLIVASAYTVANNKSDSVKV